MAKKSEGYGFNVGGEWVYPEYSRPDPASQRGAKRQNEGARAQNTRPTTYGYDPSDVRRHMDASARGGRSDGQVYGAPTGRGGANGSMAQGQPPHRDGYVQRASDMGGVHPVRAVRSPHMNDSEGSVANRGASGRSPYERSPYDRSTSARATSGRSPYDRSTSARTTSDRSPYDRSASARASSDRGIPYESNRNARRIDLTQQQRASYERAYVEKHGRSPYVERGRGEAMPREDRRQAFLRDEEIRLRREAEMARLEEQKLREQQARARRAAEEERRKREAAARRAAEERVREAERQRLEFERRRVYEENKRKFEAQRRAREERERLERRRALERIRRRRRILRTIGVHLKISLLTVLATAMVLGALGYMRFWTDKADFSARVTYTYGKDTLSGVPKELAYIDGVMCVDFIRVAQLFEFYTVGDSERVKFIISDEGREQSVTVVPGSVYVEVNGTPLQMSVPSRYEGEALLVSSEIMSLFTEGVVYETDGKRNVSIQRIVSRDEDGKAMKDDDGEYIYNAVGLLYKEQGALKAPDLSVIYGDESLGIGLGTVVTFNTELEGFEHYMNPSDSTEYLKLVNKQNLLASDYIPEALTEVASDDGATVQLCLYAAKSLEAMLIEMKDAGYEDVRVTGGYVSYQTQLDRFNGYIADEMAKGNSENEAMRLVLSYFSAPGTDEHQTGLAVDIHNLADESEDFANEEAYVWLKDNAWKFGFILRYPDGAEDITGYSFEPWHYRYVGRYAAEKIYKSGITLEEYLSGNR